MQCKMSGCEFPADPETGWCGFHAGLIQLARTNMAMAAHQPPPKRIPRCRRCKAKMFPYSFRPGHWLFECPNGCEYCGDCRKYIDYRTRCPHGIPRPETEDGEIRSVVM
jgi:hypothetical protein